MITHLLFKGLNSFNIGSIMFRKILAVIVAVLIFALVFLAVKFTKVEVPNFNRNLIMLAVVDILAFGLVMWKFGCPMEKCGKEPEMEVEAEPKVDQKQEPEVAEADGASKEGEVAGAEDKKTKESGNNAKEDEAEAEEEAGDEVEEEVKEESK
jgi:hypothetical protein